MAHAADNIIPYPRDAQGPKVLIVDDSSANRQVLKGILKSHGCRIATARDGAEAVEAVLGAHPDIVLMDVNMPVMNGYEAVRRIKQAAGDSIIPVMFVTSLNDDESLATCLEAGGDDFITIPVNETILMARIHALLRHRERSQRLAEQERQLLRYEEMVEREQEVATSIFDAVMKRDALDAGNIRYSISPMAVFNGDLLLGARKPNGDLQILLGDFTGHGLAASIGSLPTSEIFHAMSAKGFGIVDIMAEINRRLSVLMPTGMFVVAAGVEISAQGDSAVVWAGGVPDLLVRRRAGAIERIAARHLPLGVGGDELFERSFDMLSLAPGDRLYLFTDGVTEAENPAGEMYGMNRLEQAIAAAPRETAFDFIGASLDRFRAGHAQNDDATLLEYTCPATPAPAMMRPYQLATPHTAHCDSEWHIDLHLDAAALRDLDPRPLIAHLLNEVEALQSHRERLYTVLAELFSNALDHGVLGLDSAMKSDAEGFDAYYRLRAERLRALRDGWIRLSLNHRPDREGGRLMIQMQDSGEGFNPTLLKGCRCELGAADEKLSGRGFCLLRELCDSVMVFPPGNHIEVVYTWRHAQTDPQVKTGAAS